MFIFKLQIKINPANTKATELHYKPPNPKNQLFL